MMPKEINAHKMIRIVIVAFFLISISCTTVRNVENSNEINRVLKAFNDKTDHPREIYFRSVNTSPNFPNVSRKQFIKEPGKMVVDSYNQKYMEKWISSVDSLSDELTYQQKDSVKNGIYDKFKINPEKLFTDEDKKYMLDQIDTRNNIKWQMFEFTGLKLTKSDRATKISTPVFFKDHHLAMIFLSSPSYEGVEVYRQKNEDWEFYFGSTFLIE